MFQNKTTSFLQALPLVATVLFAVAASGQTVPSNMRADPHSVDLAFTYDGVRAGTTGGASIWLQGGSLQLHAKFYRGFGLVADATALRGIRSSSNSDPDLIFVAFGPRYTLRGGGGRYGVYGQVLAGQANGSHGNFPLGSGPVDRPANGTSGTASSLAFQPGGGVNIRLNRRLSLRAIEVDYLRTQLPNAETNVQNNIRLDAGIILRLNR